MSLSQPSTSDFPRTRDRARSQRVLACVLCQQRKVKCDRKFPCANCLRFQKECIPATVTPRRRRRHYPERNLLDRIRKYEALLRKNRIAFDALEEETTGNKIFTASSTPAESEDDVDGDEEDDNDDSTDDKQNNANTTSTPNESNEAKNLWHILRRQWSQASGHDSEEPQDEVSLSRIRRAMDQVYVNNDHLLFGLRHSPINLTTSHPDPIQLFRLWQVYLTNVDPLLKVTHIPTLQSRIIEAAANLQHVNPTLEALMFGIYVMAVGSLTTEECQTSFNSSRDELLIKYRFACQHALLNCEYLRTSDRECLTAFYLFLLSIGPSTDPRSLSSMLGVAMRIACRMGIHSESNLSNCNQFEAEMRRRLWWSLKIIDSRIGEMAGSKMVTLDPTWDCKIPLNVNDSDLRLDMKEPPSPQSPTSDALFVVVWSEVGDFIRHTKFHLDFTNPLLNSLAQAPQKNHEPEASQMDRLERLIEEKYLKSCDPDNPLHLMTLCTARIQLAKCHLLEHYWRHEESPEAQTEAQRDIMLRHALTILEYDARITSSTSLRGYRWIMHFYFPFPAYVHVLQDLQKRPSCSQAKNAWETVSNHFEVRVNVPEGRESPFFDLFTKLVLSAWEAREKASSSKKARMAVPAIVSIIRDRIAQKSHETQAAGTEPQDDFPCVNLGGLPTTVLTGPDDIQPGFGGQNFDPGTAFNTHPLYNLTGDANPMPLPALDWTFGGTTFW